ncbi:MAG: glycosyltransferase family 4 protein [Patescibacteria group bacterium]
MNKKRILIFSLAYYPKFIGGAEVAIKEITDRLGSDFEFDMVTLRLDSDLPKVEKIGNVMVHRVGWAKKGASTHTLSTYLHLNKYAMLFTAFREASRLHKEHKYDAIWSIMATYNSFAALFFKLRHADVPFLLTLQEGDPIPYIKRRALPLWPLFKLIFKKADAIQAISHYLAGFAKDMGATCPVIMVPNGVDIDLFARDYSQNEVDQIRLKFRKREDDIFLFSSSRLVTKNAVEDLVASMPLLPKNIKLIIAGKGDMESSLRKQSQMLGVADRVHFIGWLSHADMPLYLRACDIFIRTPISEGFGNSYVEAMAAGVPCIATPVGGIVDFLRDGETGIFAKVRDRESIANVVMELIRNPDLVSKIKRSALEMVMAKYDWKTVSEDMKKIFYELL